jgi:hypothetical protein
MLSRSVETNPRQWATRDWIPHIIGALLTLIVVSGAISAHGQQAPRGAPAQTFSPAVPSVSPPTPVAPPFLRHRLDQ